MLTDWLYRTVLVCLLLAAYLWAWPPARTLWTAQSAALLEHLVDARAADGAVAGSPDGHVLRVTVNDTTGKYTAPAGVKFLLPAGFLVLVAPRRPRVGTFFAGHLLLGGLALGLLAGCTAGLPGGFGLSRFLQTYVVDAYSLAVPVLAFARTRYVEQPTRNV